MKKKIISVLFVMIILFVQMSTVFGTNDVSGHPVTGPFDLEYNCQ